MKFALLALMAALLGGCAVHKKETLAQARSRGVSEHTMAKLENRGVLAPGDLIELKQHGVSDAVPIRQLDKVGVDYVAQRDDYKRLRSAGVGKGVNAALEDASRRFVRDRYTPDAYFFVDGYPSPWHYAGPWWWPYADVSVGYTWGHWRKPGHRHH